MKPVWAAGFTAFLLALGSLPVQAQPVLGAKSGIVNYVEGQVYLADKLLELTPAQFPDVKENTVLRTEEGRAEVLLTPGTVLRLGENTGFKMITNRLIDTRLEVLAGSAIIESAEIAKDTNVTVVCKNGTAKLAKAGLYRFDVQPARLKVFKGAADVEIGGQIVSVPAGKMLLLGGALAAAEKFNADETDSLDHWSRRRGELMAMSNVSAANRARTWGVVDPCVTGYWQNYPMIRPFGTWGYNPYYGMGTYIPCSGSVYSPYGFRYWSPMAVYRAYYAPRPTFNPGGFGGGMPSYPTMGATSGGYSGTVAASPSVSASPAAAASTGSSAASSAGASSAGHGSGGGGGAGGGHGH